MTNTTIKTVLFAGLFAALLIPFMGQQEAEASMATPIFEVASGQGITVTWNGEVSHSPSNWEWGTQTNWCGQSFTASGFYDTTYNKRGASHYFPDRINQTCNFDNDTAGYFNVTLDKVEYTLTGDGNTTILKYNMGNSYANYKIWNDAYSNSGIEYVTVKATYVHTS